MSQRLKAPRHPDQGSTFSFELQSFDSEEAHRLSVVHCCAGIRFKEAMLYTGL